MRVGWILIASSALILAAPVFSQSITVFVVHAKNGRPLNGQPVDVYNADVLPLRLLHFGKTGADGLASVTLPVPAPEVISIHPGQWSGARNMYSVKEISTVGVISKNQCRGGDKLEGKFQPKPGQIIVFVSPPRWWQGQT
jgi:hypothetical protein